MREWIAGVMLILGALLVTAGGSAAFAGAIAETRRAEGPSGAPGEKRAWWTELVDSLARLKAPADRMIAWGIVLLVLAAVASGAVAFTLGASAGTNG
jgi:hypothetical protein